MKKLSALFATLVLGATLQAAPIAPGQWLLQITSNNLSTFEIGPDTYAHWFDGGVPGTQSGYVSYLIFTAVPQHIIASWMLIPCPMSAPCELTATSAPGTLPEGPQGAPGTPNTVPEPAAFVLCLGALGACAVSRPRWAS